MNIDDTAQPAVAPAVLDPHGHAALLLVESLIHGLCEKAVLSTRDAVDIAERAASVQRDVSDAAVPSTPMRQAHALLVAIAGSLQIDEADTVRSKAPAGNQ